MKQTEIIIETQRVTVIQRRRQSNQRPDYAGLTDVPASDIADGNNRISEDEELSNKGIQEEEKDSCTDSRDR